MGILSKKKLAKAGRPTLAETSDKHVLYQQSVQMPEIEVVFLSNTYEQLRGKLALVFKEDFCGTAMLSTEWVKSNLYRTAIGVDLCADTLKWGEEHNVKPAGADVARRIQLLNADVRSVTEPKADITCAFNFSFSVFKTRAEMCEYFKAVHAGLAKDGLFFLDLFGGTDCPDVLEEETEIDDFNGKYLWEHAAFNPINNHLLCHIHFEFDDGSRMDKAFTYDWRLWSIPELSELLVEAGFSKVRIYWERFEDDKDNEDYMEGTGEFSETTEEENQESWQCYIIGEV